MVTDAASLGRVNVIYPGEKADVFRTEISESLSRKRRYELGQFLTPTSVATFMASLFGDFGRNVVLLDPGAGIGSLTAAFVQEALRRHSLPVSIIADAYELESEMLPYLSSILNDCKAVSSNQEVGFQGSIITDDFIERGVEGLSFEGGLFKEEVRYYTHCIMNPPYKKIQNNSKHRKYLSAIGIETSNLYSGFLAIAIKLLAPGGELVAIVPRSFCNGVYFKPFRQLLLDNVALKRLHVFDSRTAAFKEDEVLQENIIFHAVKGAKQGRILVTSSDDPSFDGMTHREVEFESIVKPGDPDRYIHVAASDFDQMVVDHMAVFSHSLSDLGLNVSTGPVVDFRLSDDIRQIPEEGTVPLIYPSHFTGNEVVWPKLDGKKPNAIFESTKSSRWLMVNGWYVVTRRFSAKEERKRIIGAIHNPSRIPGERVGFENHLNVIHHQQGGLDADIAKGLAVYLNSTLLDLYFRQFSGHTQVNAADLRNIHYPNLESLARLGRRVGEVFPDQATTDSILETEIEIMAKNNKRSGSPLRIRKKIQESLLILQALGLPKGQQNERSALTLLALLDIKPRDTWKDAGNPLMGITPIMEFAADHYGKNYAPNTRETFRRQTMHQFVDAGLAVPNPDSPDRPINSPNWVYGIEPLALELIRTYGSEIWEHNLKQYLKGRKTLAEQYAKRREMRMVNLALSSSHELALSPGAHSELIKEIIEEFGPRYAPGAEVLYVGDTGSKLAHFDKAKFLELGLEFDSHGKFPDVVLYEPRNNWLFLVESVTSHGPVDPKRHAELSALFGLGRAGLVYVTAFPDRQTMTKYLSQISWETEVWTADSPSHLIHFDGERFLGPYKKK